MSARAAAALAAAVDRLEPLEPEAWRFTARAGDAVVAGRAAVDGDWLDLDVAAPPAMLDELDDWRALERNATLPPGVRLAATAAGFALRADVPITGDADAAAVRAALAALATAAGLVGGASPAPPPADAAGLVAATHFATAPRGDDEWTVDLGIPDVARRVTVRRMPDATLALAIALADGPAAACSEAARAAVARLLGRVAVHVRLARPAVDPAAPGSLRIEALGVRPEVPALDRACGALAAACRLAAAEAAALLSDDALARRYLALDAAAAVPRAA